MSEEKQEAHETEVPLVARANGVPAMRPPRTVTTTVAAHAETNEDSVPRPRSRSRVPFTREMMTTALHVYNPHGVKHKNTRDEVREWHYKGLHLRKPRSFTFFTKQQKIQL